MTRYFKQFWPSNLLYLGLTTITSIQTILSALLSAAQLNALIKFDFPLFLRWVLWDVGNFIILLAMYYWQAMLRAKTTQKMDNAVRDDLTNRICALPYTAYHARQTDDYSSWLSNDINQIETQGFTNVYSLVDSGLIALFSLITLVTMHWTLAAAALGFSGLMIVVPVVMRRHMAKASQLVSQKNEHFMQVVNDHLKGFDTLLALNHQPLLHALIHDAQQPLAAAKVHQTKIQAIASTLGNFTNITAQISIIFITALLAFQHIVSIGLIQSTGTLSFRVFSMLASLSSQLTLISGTNALFTKYDQLPAPAAKESQVLPTVTSGFVLRDLTITYGQTKAVADLNQDFRLGGKYAIVGPSGSGKSTLFNLLAGKLTAYAGSLTLNGQEYRTLSTTAIRDQVLYLDQIPYIFSGTVRDNLTLGDDYPDAALIAALQRADLWDQVRRLPQGLDSGVGENGRTFSGGQRQRLALARGFLRHKQIVLMDEGTASLDKDQALKIEETLLADPKLTVLMITHQLYPEIEPQLTGVIRMIPSREQPEPAPVARLA